MCNHWAGFALTNNGEIGPQGSSNLGSDNFWDFVGSCQPWGTNPALNETYVDGTSNPMNSPLYTTSFPGFFPTNNGWSVPSQPYMSGPSLWPAAAPNGANVDCYLTNPYLAGPSWKNSPTAIVKTELPQSATMQVYPNPTNGTTNLRFSSTIVNGQVQVIDLAGSIYYRKVIENTGIEVLDLSDLPNGVYFIELTDNSAGKTVSKLIINK
jgi:hypothetical protein